MVGLTEVARLFVSVTVWAALAVPTVCAAKVSVAGAIVSGKAAVPLASSICWLIAALSVMTTAPLMAPLAPSAGENVTLSVQLAFAARFRLAAHGFAPLPAAAKSPLAAMLVKVIELALVFFTVTTFAALVVPTASAVKVTVVGEKVSGAVLPPEPVPESAMSCGENPAASVMLTAPLTLPFAVGVNVIAILHLAAAPSDAPQVVPVELMA
jgi:hypothetical protein